MRKQTAMPIERSASLYTIRKVTTGETYYSGNSFRLSSCAGKTYGCNNQKLYS